MTSSLRAFAFIIVAALATTTVVAQPRKGATPKPAAPPPAAAPSPSFATVNVCERVTGEAVATATGGKLIDTRPVNIANFDAARCVYGITIDDSRRTFVLWFNPPADYDELRKVATAPKVVADLGDAAHVTVDAETKRYSLTTVKKGKVTIQVTGDRSEWVEAIAKLALAAFE